LCFFVWKKNNPNYYLLGGVVKKNNGEFSDFFKKDSIDALRFEGNVKKKELWTPCFFIYAHQAIPWDLGKYNETHKKKNEDFKNLRENVN
jgi:hypothetical protein